MGFKVRLTSEELAQTRRPRGSFYHQVTECSEFRDFKNFPILNSVSSVSLWCQNSLCALLPLSALASHTSIIRPARELFAPGGADLAALLEYSRKPTLSLRGDCSPTTFHSTPGPGGVRSFRMPRWLCEKSLTRSAILRFARPLERT
jgi:hypothetical protein